MKTLNYLSVLGLIVLFSACNQDSKKTDKLQDEEQSKVFTIETNGLEVEEYYYAINDYKNKAESNSVPFGSKLYFVLNGFSGLTEVNELYNIGFRVSLYDGDKLLRHVDDIFANDPGRKPDDFSNIYVFLDIFYPVQEGKTYTIKTLVWDKNSENKLAANGNFKVTGKAPGNFKAKAKNVEFASIILKKNDEIAKDNNFKPGDIIRIVVEGVTGFEKNEEGYSFAGSYTVTDKAGNVLFEEQGKDVYAEKMTQLISSIPVTKVPEPTDIFWNVTFKDNNSDSEITVTSSILLVP